MNVLLIGSRGREHAIITMLRKDERVGEIYCMPANGGIAKIARCVEDVKITDFDAVLKFLDEHKDIELTIISPDELLASGMVEFLTSHGHRAFGPSGRAAEIEASKSCARSLCEKYKIPAPKFKAFDDYTAAKKYVSTVDFSKQKIVVKTDGRTAGKFYFCRNLREAETALYDVMLKELFGKAGKRVVIEEHLSGVSVMVTVFTDGKTVVPAPAVNCFKRAFDNDLGMSTAGMGAATPVSAYNQEISERVQETIIKPLISALKEEGREFKGVLGVNVILTPDGGAKAVDFVVRFCDVESQALLPLLETPLLDVFNAVIDGNLADVKIKWSNKHSACVILASGGYPVEEIKSRKIHIGEIADGVQLFHAGTKIIDGVLKTSGGRVMGVASVCENGSECLDKIYKSIDKIHFEFKQYRKDIIFK